MDGAEVFRTEEVAEIGRHAREAAAIAGDDDEIGDQAEMLDQELHSRAGNEAGKAEAHDGQTRSEAPVFREPFDQSRYGRDIARS